MQQFTVFGAPLFPDLFAVILSVLFALAVLVTKERPLVRWLVPCLAFLPVPLVALISPQFGLVGWHGFMHSAPIYQIMNGGPVPPEEPLFAGGTLRYPWVEHWIVAQLSGFTGVNVHWLTLAIEIIAYAALLLAGGRLAALLSKDRASIALGVLFTGFGISIFHAGLLVDAFQRAFPSLWLETRVVPLDKFANISAMPIGYAAFATAAVAGLRLASETDPPRRQARVVLCCTALASLLHPLSWLCILAFQGVVGVVLLATRKRQELLHAAWLAAAVILPSVVALPYLRAVGASESSDGWTGLTYAELFWAKLGDAAVFLGPLLLVAYVERARLRRMLAEGNRALGIVLLSIPCMVAAYLVLRFPGRNEYKFLLTLVPGAAAVLGLCLRPLLDRHQVLAGALLVLLLTPGARMLGIRPGFQVTEPCRTDGPYLQAINANNNALYRWIATETPKDAVFVSESLRIPPLGRRSLYIAMPAQWLGRDGWGLDRFSLLEWHIRRPDAVMLLRQQRAVQVLAPVWSKPAGELVNAIQADVPGRPLFVHASEPRAISKLEQTPGFVRRFSNLAGAVYAVTPSDAPLPATAAHVADQAR
jgi:hypothetical protein